MANKVIFGIVAAAIIITAFFMGEIPLLVLFGILVIIATNELLSSMKKAGYRPIEVIAYIYAALFVPCYYFMGAYSLFAMSAVVIIISFSTGLVMKRTIPDIVSSLLILIYPFALVTIALFAVSPESAVGKTAIALGVACGTFSDIFAFIAGSLWGKKKLCPNISPKKTVEGAIGGFICGGVLGSLLIWFSQSLWLASFPLWILILVGLSLAAIAQFGDLTASSIKRAMDIKDFSGFIPGHGGILDRVDSALFAVPSAYIILSLIVDWSKF